MTGERQGRRLRWAGIWLLAGVTVQGLTLLRVHPLTFTAHLGLGSGMVVVGVVLFLWTSLRGTPRPAPGDDPEAVTEAGELADS